MAEAARARSRRTREDVVGILMTIVVDVPVLSCRVRSTIFVGRRVEFEFDSSATIRDTFYGNNAF
jgi:hypothetical protein